MPGIGTLQRLPPEKANVYHDLKAVMFRFRDCISSRTIAQVLADVGKGEGGAELPNLLRAMGAALTAAGALTTLRFWHSARGLPSWEDSFGFAMCTIITGMEDHFECVLDAVVAAADECRQVEEQGGAAGYLRNTLVYHDLPERWCDFQAAVAEYVDELLAALKPAGLDEDPAALKALREVLRANRRGKNAKPDDLIKAAHLGKQRGRKALRQLEARGEYQGFHRQTPRRYQGPTA